MKIIKNSFLLILGTSTMLVRAMNFENYFMVEKTVDYTIFCRLIDGMPLRTFSFLSTKQNEEKTSTFLVTKKIVTEDAIRNAASTQNQQFLEELTRFKVELVTAKNRKEYEKKILIMELIQQSKLLKLRFVRKGRAIDKRLYNLGDPNVYILEHLKDIEAAKQPKVYGEDLLSDQGFCYH